MNNTQSQSNSWFLEKVMETDKPLTNLTKRKKEKLQINKTRDQKGVITFEGRKERKRKK